MESKCYFCWEWVYVSNMRFFHPSCGSLRKKPICKYCLQVKTANSHSTENYVQGILYSLENELTPDSELYLPEPDGIVPATRKRDRPCREKCSIQKLDILREEAQQERPLFEEN